MLLKSVRIDLITYGVEKGSYEVKITIAERYGEIELKLPPEAGSAFVDQAKELIHKFSVRAADQLYRDLELSHPELKPVAAINDVTTDGVTTPTA